MSLKKESLERQNLMIWPLKDGAKSINHKTEIWFLKEKILLNWMEDKVRFSTVFARVGQIKKKIKLFKNQTKIYRKSKMKSLNLCRTMMKMKNSFWLLNFDVW